MRSVLIVPGIGNSGPGHWQTQWERQEPGRFKRIEQADWERPHAPTWSHTFVRAVEREPEPVVIVAHSLGTLLSVLAVPACEHKVAAALLVSVPDPAGAAFPRAEATGFDTVPRRRLVFPSLVVMSSNDPYGSVEHARELAQCWGSAFTCIGEAGHINASSGLACWAQGRALLDRLIDPVATV